MPVYEYLCTGCGHEFEQRRSMSEDAPPCPSCGQHPRRRISLFAASMADAPGGGGCACGGACGCAN